MKDTIGLILLIVAVAFLFSPEWLGQNTRKMIDAFHQPEDKP